MRGCVVTVSLVVLIAWVASLRAAPPPEPLVEQVRKSIEQSKDYLIRRQSPRGDWDVEDGAHQGGPTSLAMLALLNAGLSPDDPVIQKGLQWLRTVPPSQTYVVGLQTMVFALAAQDQDRPRMDRNVKWLIDARCMQDAGTLAGWTYTMARGRSGGADNSNSQYAILGLHEAQVAGISAPPSIWEQIGRLYLNTQDKRTGGWGYRRGAGTTLTMTTAGLCGLLMASMDLNKNREIGREGHWQNCGEYVESGALDRAQKWLADRFPNRQRLGIEQHLFYCLYGIERAGRLTGLRFIGQHDWYRVGCQYLVQTQGADGSWRGENGSIVSTSFALLFLSKGRTPVLITKIPHDGNDGAGHVFKADASRNDWNNDRNSARHLADFCSRELFKRQPMGWQIFNPRETNVENVDELVAELLQSPLVHISGHLAPEFSGQEEEMLRKYIANGGFIFADACCGRPQFDRGFRRLMARLFPDNPLQPLPASHSIWTASGKFLVPPNNPFKLEGIQICCKTAVVYCPQDLSCWWESNLYDKGQAKIAFQLGANIVAYATGLEPPRPRLTPMEVIRDEPMEKLLPRGYLKAAQVRHEGDWQSAPRAMSNLMRQLRDKSRLDVVIPTEPVHPDRAEVIDFKFLYMHGRNDFQIPQAKLADLRFNLETGGLLFADAICGSKTFDKGFRQLIAELWPQRKLQPIPLTDELYGKELNGTAITTVRCRRDTEGRRDLEYRTVEPFLEGVRINGRWAVIYSKYDIGCALEKSKSPDCLGHDYDSAVRLGSAVVQYAFKR